MIRAQVCFDSTAFYSVMVVGFAVIIYVIVTISQNNITNTESYYRSIVSDRGHGDRHRHMHRHMHRHRQHGQNIRTDLVQRLEDIQRMSDPLTAPNRRSLMPAATYRTPAAPIFTPSRGEYDNFQQMGYLYNTDDAKQAMPLVGRRIHSNQYEYYTFHHYNPSLKLPITVTGNKELNDGDNVQITGYQNQFKTKLYDIDVPRYVPY